MKRLSRRTNIARLLKRREVLGFFGAMTSVWLAGCFRSQSNAVETENTFAQASTPASDAASTQSALAANPLCVVRPEQTEGPFFVDADLNRSDIRSDPSDHSVRPGVPLQVIFQVSQMSNGACTPLQNALVDVWHCDAQGVYSNVGETTGQKFLRGSQVTNAEGIAQFTTIYPGWYPGRTVHIHFKIRGNSASQIGYEFTSQVYFDDALTDRVLAQSAYANRGDRTVRNEQDFLFQRGGEQLIMPVVQEGDRHVGKFAIALEL